MLTPNGDGKFTGGPLDIILIYRHIDGGTFHPVFCEEHPVPGPASSFRDAVMVRLMIGAYHGHGFATLEEAQEYVRTEMRTVITLPDNNVAIERSLPWDGELADVWTVLNWRRNGNERIFSEANLVPAEAAPAG